jgi:sulfate adenylyltransferase large subunit
MAALVTENFSVEEFLAQERGKDLLRFSTAGSVDDGKSTLIGRLLYDTQSVYEDQVKSIEGKGTTAPGQIDFALLTDGLRAEREQGITIDVAYRYFSTPRRKFIIADTPGHEQYTRNMATGASTADATVVLIDASKGVLTQSRRHAFIASLLRVRHLIVAVNKMDLIGYDQPTFDNIARDFRNVLARIGEDTGTTAEPTFVPVSALAGDNVVHRTDAMPWYTGPSLLEILENVPSQSDHSEEEFRFPVQRVVRPDHTFRGFSGQIVSGTVRPGDAIRVLPSGREAVIQRIVTFDGDLYEAHAPLSVTLVLDREIDISRGDLITSPGNSAQLSTHMQAAIVWMDRTPLALNRRYLLKHTSHTVPAFVTGITHRTNVETLTHEAAASLDMNGIGVIDLSLMRPLAIDLYVRNRGTGAFILIDPETNSTAGAGMITAATVSVDAEKDADADAWGRVTAGEREARWGHRGGALELTGPSKAIDAVERSLFSVGAVTTRVDAESDLFLLHPELLHHVLRANTQAGLLSLVVRSSDGAALTASVEATEVVLDTADIIRAVSSVHQLLNATGIFISAEKANL